MPTDRVRLDTWKEISAELRVSERTARRYEMREDLPVHRHMHERRESVYAWADELALWKESRSAAGGPRSHSSDDHWQANATQRLPLIGRDQQRNLLLRAVEAARLGHGSLVLIEGEPGIGKSHLMRVLLAQAEQEGCFGMVGHCRDMEGAPPYGPFIEMLEYCAWVFPRDAFRRSLGDSAAEITRLIPELRQVFADIPAPMELPAEQQRRFLFNACREFIGRSAALKPIVAVFEDLQWADEATLLLFEHLAQTVSTVPVLLAGTFRSAHADVGRPFARLLERYIRDKSVTRLTLRPLTSPDVGELLDQLSGQTTPAKVISFFVDQTDGNPFFIEELFLDLRAQHRLFDEHGAWRDTLPNQPLHVPQGIRLVIKRRLDRLQERTHRQLRIAAVAGRSFDVRLLESLENADADGTLDALDEAQSAQLIEAADQTEREPKYRFVHELVRQTLAESLSPARRQRLHALIAYALERLYGGNLESHASALAHHFYEAGTAADVGQTIRYILLAARAATSSAAHESALTEIERALLLAQTERQPDVADLVACKAAALLSLSRVDEAIDTFEQAIELFNASERFPEAAASSHSLGNIYLWRADPAGACAITHRAVEAVGTRAPLARYRLQLLNSVSLGLKGDMEAAFAALAEARQMESSLPDRSPDDIGYAHRCEARIRYYAAQLKTAAECARAAVAQFRATGNLWAEVDTFEVTSDLLLQMRSDGERDKLLAESFFRAERVGHRNAAWAYKFMSAEMLMHRGELEKAERAALDMHAFATQIGTSWAFFDYVLLASVAYYRGKFDQAVEWTRRGLAVEPECYMSGQLSGCLFWALAANGDPAAEMALAAARAYLPVEGHILTIGSSSCLSFVVEGLALAGRTEELAALETRSEWALANGPICLYTRHLFRTSAGITAACARNWTRAEEHHQAAISIADSTACRVAQPVVRYWYADMLWSRDRAGDRVRARQLLSEAVSLYNRAGMAWHARYTANRLSSCDSITA